MNSHKTIIKIRESTRILLKEEIKKLGAGYNPSETNIMSNNENMSDINPQSYFLDALQFAYKKIQGSDVSKCNKDEYKS